MTAYKARLGGKNPSTKNKKDGIKRRRRDTGDKWIDIGFTWPGPQRSVYKYTWPGDFPVFRIGPDLHEDESGLREGLVARCQEVAVFFEYGTNPAEIKARLDDEILAIVRYEVGLIEAEIEYKAEVGPEVDIDLWMTRPQEAIRQSTPAVQRLATRHGVSLSVADEIMVERGE